MSGDPGRTSEVVAELEELGFASLWVPTFGPGAFEVVERVLVATTDVVVATGILNVWRYGAAEAADAHRRLNDAHGNRFVLGLGVSHGPVVDRFVPGATYAKPLAKMRSYLDELDGAPRPVPVGERVLAALGPKMLELAATAAGGAHPYNVTPEHTAIARQALGSEKLLVPEQAIALTTSADDARRWARAFLANYLPLPNYAGNLRRLGFTDDDLDHGGSDRLVDALVAMGGRSGDRVEAPGAPRRGRRRRVHPGAAGGADGRGRDPAHGRLPRGGTGPLPVAPSRDGGLSLTLRATRKG